MPDTPNLTPEREAEIQRRCEAATPPPWVSSGPMEELTTGGERRGCTLIEAKAGWAVGGRTIAHIGHWLDRPMPDADADFIAHAREDMPLLLATIDEQRAALEAVYPILCGIVNEHHLDPKDARYVSDGWKVKETVRGLLGYAAELVGKEEP